MDTNPVQQEPTMGNEQINHLRASAHQEAHQPKQHRRKRRRLPLVIIIVVLVIALVGGGFFAYNRSGVGGTIDGSKYQAVFFTNGQVYFGKLSPLNHDYMKLTDIFYLQSTATTSSNPQQTNTDTSSNVQLIKLGDEIHGPEDEMVLNKDQVLFFENLKSDGKVTQSIQNYKKQ